MPKNAKAYSDEFKQARTLEWLEGASAQELGKQYRFHPTALYDWKKRFFPDRPFPARPKPPLNKKAAMLFQLVTEEKLTISEAAKKLKVPIGTAHGWLGKLRKGTHTAEGMGDEAPAAAPASPSSPAIAVPTAPPKRPSIMSTKEGKEAFRLLNEMERTIDQLRENRQLSRPDSAHLLAQLALRELEKLK